MKLLIFRSIINRILSYIKLVSLLGNYDVIVASYPKTGRTWLRMLIGSYVNFYYKLSIPMEELSRTEKLDDYLPGFPRTLFLHYGQPQFKRLTSLRINFRLIKKKKVLFLVRDPRPTAVSYYYHFWHRGAHNRFIAYNKRKYGVKAQISSNIDEFVLGEYGGIKSIIAYYNLWLKDRNRIKCIYTLRYEDLLNETTKYLSDVLNFFSIPVNYEIIKKTTAFCSANNLRKLEQEGKLNRIHFGGTNANNSKVRKGLSKKWDKEVKENTKNAMNEEVNRNLDSSYNYK